jgi:hypothetical protein
MHKDALMEWIKRLGIGGNWLDLLPFFAVAGLCVFILILSIHSSRRAEERKRLAKKYEEYCRLYEAGQRESDDAGFRKYVQDRKDHDEFIKRRKNRMPA